jgi:hypothetical protein
LLSLGAICRYLLCQSVAIFGAISHYSREMCSYISRANLSLYIYRRNLSLSLGKISRYLSSQSFAISRGNLVAISWGNLSLFICAILCYHMGQLSLSLRAICHYLLGQSVTISQGNMSLYLLWGNLSLFLGKFVAISQANLSLAIYQMNLSLPLRKLSLGKICRYYREHL